MEIGDKIEIIHPSSTTYRWFRKRGVNKVIGTIVTTVKGGQMLVDFSEDNKELIPDMISSKFFQSFSPLYKEETLRNIPLKFSDQKEVTKIIGKFEHLKDVYI